MLSHVANGSSEVRTGWLVWMDAGLLLVEVGWLLSVLMPLLLLLLLVPLLFGGFVAAR